MTLRRALIRTLDRPGGRALLAPLVTRLARKQAPGVRVYFDRGMWMHCVGERIFVDFPTMDYHPHTFRFWANEADRVCADAQDHWFHVYRPRPGDLIVDVGAGKGEDALAFSRAAGASGKVLAIEAHPVTYRCLRLFCELNGLRNVEPRNFAITDKSGPVAIESAEGWQANSIADSPAAVTAPGITLDELMERENIRRIDFLKMNIEGAEALAIQGMERTFQITQVLCICCHDFRAASGDGEQFRTRKVVEDAVRCAGFGIVSRAADGRPYVADQVNAVRGLESR